MRLRKKPVLQTNEYAWMMMSTLEKINSPFYISLNTRINVKLMSLLNVNNKLTQHARYNLNVIIFWIVKSEMTYFNGHISIQVKCLFILGFQTESN